MTRPHSLAYLGAHRCQPAEAVVVAAQAGYQALGLRLWPNAPGLPYQDLVGDARQLRETQAALRDTGLRVLDLEIIRLAPDFDLHRWDAMLAVGQQLGAAAVLVAGDDTHGARLTDNFARLCEHLRSFDLTADLEFMPWTAVKDAKAAMQVLRGASLPSNAGVLVDALHVARSTTTLQDIAQIPRQCLHYAQINDAQPGLHFTTEALIHTARCARLLPGQGGIDLKGLMSVLPPDLPMSVEVINLEQEINCPPLPWAKACLQASLAYTT